MVDDKKDDVDDIVDALLNGSIVRVDRSDDDNLGKDLQVIAKEMNKDSNVFRFGNTGHQNLGRLSLLGAIGDRPFYKTKDSEGNVIKPRYAFVQSFLYHYSVNRSALKSGHAERFKELAGSLLGFKAMLEYRASGIRQDLGEDRKHSLLDKIKKS